MPWPLARVSGSAVGWFPALRGRVDGSPAGRTLPSTGISGRAFRGRCSRRSGRTRSGLRAVEDRDRIAGQIDTSAVGGDRDSERRLDEWVGWRGFPRRAGLPQRPSTYALAARARLRHTASATRLLRQRAARRVAVEGHERVSLVDAGGDVQIPAIGAQRHPCWRGKCGSAHTSGPPSGHNAALLTGLGRQQAVVWVAVEDQQPVERRSGIYVLAVRAHDHGYDCVIRGTGVARAVAGQFAVGVSI